jgi:methionyl-tRNA formyltransferase
MGTPEFAVPSLSILLQNDYTLPAVVTAPDKPRGRGQQVLPTPVKQLATAHNLSVLQPVSLKEPAFIDEVRRLAPDLIVVVAFRILPREVFSAARLGSFNLHASLLPKYRGAAPINWAIINGETETGVTTFLLHEKVDTGGILLQARIPITPGDDAGTLHDKLAEIGAEIVLHTVRLLEQDKASPKPQDDALASPAPKIFKEHCKIHWEWPAMKIHNLVRGLSPHPTAFTTHRGKILKVYKTMIVDKSSRDVPGKVFTDGHVLHVSTESGLLAITELQQEGRRRMHAGEFLRGYRLVTGDLLE